MVKEHWYEVKFERVKNPLVIDVPMTTAGYDPRRVFTLLNSMTGSYDLRFGDWNGFIRLKTPDQVWFWSRVSHWGATPSPDDRRPR